MKNTIKRAMLFDGKAQVAVVDAKKAIADAKKIHNLSEKGAKLLGDALTLTAYLSIGLKNEKGKLSIVIESDGGKIVTAAKSGGCYGNKIKGFITCENVDENAGLTIVSDLGLKQPYVSKLSISEINFGANVFISPMPFCPEELKFILEDTKKLIADAGDVVEKLGADGVLEFYFGHMEMTRLPDVDFALECDCDKARIDALIGGLDKKEIGDLLNADGKIEIKCDFCNKTYTYEGK